MSVCAHAVCAGGDGDGDGETGRRGALDGLHATHNTSGAMQTRNFTMQSEWYRHAGYNLHVTAQPYRVPAERVDHYAEAWVRLRRRRLARRLVIGAGVYGLATLLVFALKSAEFSGVVTTANGTVLAIGMALGFVFLAVASVLARYLMPFVCPRCAQPFFHGLTTEIGFAKRCVHCGLAEGSPMPVTSRDE